MESVEDSFAWGEDGQGVSVCGVLLVEEGVDGVEEGGGEEGLPGGGDEGEEWGGRG